MRDAPLLELSGATVQYPGADAPALVDVTFSIRAGERVALVGPSGAGKTTLLSLCSGLVAPSSGHVKVLGVPAGALGRRGHRSTRRRIGFITQDFGLVGPLRVASNVAAGRLGRGSWWQAIRALIRPGPIDEIRRTLDVVGIADKTWERADSLSGGQQQRTAIARTLFQEADLVLADEPVSALDPARSDSVLDVLTSHVARGERALVASIHDAPLSLRHCDRLIGLREGRVVFDRPAAEVSDRDLAALYAIGAPDDS